LAEDLRSLAIDGGDDRPPHRQILLHFRGDGDVEQRIVTEVEQKRIGGRKVADHLFSRDAPGEPQIGEALCRRFATKVLFVDPAAEQFDPDFRPLTRIAAA
jgi:hypothetical protein